MATVSQTYSVFRRIPENQLVRIGYRPNDFLEELDVRETYQKSLATTITFLATFNYYKVYCLKYGQYHILRITTQFPKWGLRQQFAYLLPIIFGACTVSFAEMTYNRGVLGIQGSLPIPDQVLAPDRILH